MNKNYTFLRKYERGDCNKIVYKNKKDAEYVLNFRNSEKRDRKLTGIYFCSKCSGWHLTSKVMSLTHYKSISKQFHRKY